MKSSAPAWMAAIASSSFGVPEITMHGRSRPFTISSARSPPNAGSIQSVIIRSHGLASAAASSSAVQTRSVATV